MDQAEKDSLNNRASVFSSPSLLPFGRLESQKFDNFVSQNCNEFYAHYTAEIDDNNLVANGHCFNGPQQNSEKFRSIFDPPKEHVVYDPKARNNFFKHDVKQQFHGLCFGTLRSGECHRKSCNYEHTVSFFKSANKNKNKIYVSVF